MSLSLKILGGACRGLNLQMPAKATTRPTKAIIKESFFNVLQSSILQSTFIEGFGGSGSMGLEALSRGAFEALVFEKDKEAFGVLQTNTQTFKARMPTARLRTIHADIFSTLAGYLEGLKPRGLVVLYLDPPFMEGIYEKCWALVASLRGLERFLQYGLLLVFEHLSGACMPKTASFSIIKTRTFGRTTLSYYLYTKE
ncbi:16S rRNA (guanine(966)-N(2))-methyltransferase RsmD [Helicobacter heilmannii]|uniref:16S rRNA (guanine(966)-N(2))-methyltransferase RsmD n=1 Tax=Helicobacter heilmannii TaxID=35817 RepID=UPI0006A1B8C9|nr:16S rRNA (guanine(966)-N(2))-methyltransferase RsmD [Helicobacter heilmannii]CRF45776.1 Ribosomal RNA small subunit methyltransferase D [Helicobacter heilmannii]